MYQAGPAPNFHFSLVRLDGSPLATVDAAASAAPWQGDGSGLVLSNGDVLLRDGTVVPMPAALEPYFNFGSTDSFGQRPGDPIAVDDHTMVGIEGGWGSAKFDVLDFVSGQRTVVFSSSAISPNTGGIQLPTVLDLGLSTDHKLARALVFQSTVNGTAVPAAAVVEVDVVRKTVVRIVPVAGLDSANTYEPAVSPDGRFLAYQENNRVDSQHVAIYTTHIVGLTTGSDMSVRDTSIESTPSPRGLRFSPDGSALVVYGTSAPASGGQESLMNVYDTSDGHLLFHQDAGIETSYQVAPIGWVSDHTLVFGVTTAGVPGSGNFSTGTQVAQSLDVTSGQTTALPAREGLLFAVLS